MKHSETQQMELGFQAIPLPLTMPRGRTRRAAWWFQRMREVVDAAFDWAPAPSSRPEQTWLAYR